MTAAFWSAGRISGADAIAYVVAQFIGAIIGSILLIIIVKGKVGGYSVSGNGLGDTTWGTYGLWAAIVAEFVGTVIFTLVILAATGEKGPGAIAGLIIGLTLMTCISHSSAYREPRSTRRAASRQRCSSGTRCSVKSGCT